LQEHILHCATGKGAPDNDRLAFALSQCNASIHLLTAGDNSKQDPGVTLVTCVLFAGFELLHGDPARVLIHCSQGRTLIRSYEKLASAGGRNHLIDPVHLRPIIASLEIQAKSLQDKAMQMSSIEEDEPPLPSVEQLQSLEHAHWTLHYVYIALAAFQQRCTQWHVPVCRMAEKHATFSPWLKQWENAFADLLFREASGLSVHDMKRAKVLKANYLAASILAGIEHGAGEDAWEPFESQCKAIVDLSAPVIETYCRGSQAMLSGEQIPWLTFGLWVAEPLFLVMSKCTNAKLRQQASGLLSGKPGFVGYHDARLVELSAHYTRSVRTMTLESMVELAALRRHAGEIVQPKQVPKQQGQTAVDGFTWVEEESLTWLSADAEWQQLDLMAWEPLYAVNEVWVS